MVRTLWTLYLRELRSSLRERQVVMFSIAVPVVLYPILLWGMFSMISLAQEREADIRPLVAVVETEGAQLLPQELLSLQTVRWAESVADSASAVELVRAEELDAAVVYHGENGLSILYSGTGEAGPLARSRLSSAMDRYRRSDLRLQALYSGIDPAAWEMFSLSTLDVSTRREHGSLILGLMLPIFFTIMVAVGSFYPAVDSTAGDRERFTWETLMSCGVKRSSVLTAKYLAVATFGTAAGLLNVASMTLSLSTVLAPLAERAQLPSFALAPASIPLVVLAALLLAGVVSAGMMILASFARNFREGQAMVQPFYIVAILPSLLLQLPSLELHPLTALIPFLNTSLLVRAAVSGTAGPLPSLITLVVSAIAIGLMLRLAARISTQEGVAAGDIRLQAPSFLRGFIEKRSRKGGNDVR